MVTPTPLPVGTPTFNIPQDVVFGTDAASQAVQMWNMLGTAADMIQIALLLLIVIGGISYIIRSLKRL